MRTVVMLGLLLAPLVAVAQPAKELRALVDKQIKWLSDGDEEVEKKIFAGNEFYQADAGSDEATSRSSIPGGAGTDRHKLKDFAATVSGDGKTAWVSYVHTFREQVSRDMFSNWTYRVTQVATKGTDGWRLVGGMWSIAQPNALVNKVAQAGSSPTFKALKGPTDASIQAAVEKLITGPLDAEAIARKDLVSIGSGPGERTVGGGKLAKPWAAGWAKKVTVDGPIVSKVYDTTGFAIANLTLEKAGKKPYKIPFRVMFVFDKDKAGGWSVAHVHFAVPTQP